MVDVDDPVRVVRDLTGGAMADVVMDIATVAQTVPLAIDLVRGPGPRCCSPGSSTSSESPTSSPTGS